MRTSSKSACTTTHLRARLRDSARQNPGAAESSPSKEQAAERVQANNRPDAHPRPPRRGPHARTRAGPSGNVVDPPSGRHSADKSAASASRSLLIETEVSAEVRLMTALGRPAGAWGETPASRQRKGLRAGSSVRALSSWTRLRSPASPTTPPFLCAISGSAERRRATRSFATASRHERQRKPAPQRRRNQAKGEATAMPAASPVAWEVGAARPAWQPLGRRMTP